jgi:hypothetical protein
MKERLPCRQSHSLCMLPPACSQTPFHHGPCVPECASVWMRLMLASMVSPSNPFPLSTSRPHTRIQALPPPTCLHAVLGWTPCRRGLLLSTGCLLLQLGTSRAFNPWLVCCSYLTVGYRRWLCLEPCSTRGSLDRRPGALPCSCARL